MPVATARFRAIRGRGGLTRGKSPVWWRKVPRHGVMPRNRNHVNPATINNTTPTVVITTLYFS